MRGATSSLGQAAVNLAADHGATVLASTQDLTRTGLLREIGATEVLLDDGSLAPQVRARGIKVDAVLDIVGNSALRDSLATVRPRGRVCQLGFLGGFDPVQDFAPLADLPSGVQLSFFGSAFVLGTADFPLAAVPFDAIYGKVEGGTYLARPTRVFGFHEIVEARRVMAAGQALGKMVVTLD